jgi:hypothetical protein
MDSNPRHAERRAWPRHPADEIQADLTLDPQQTPWQATARNISRGGILLALGEGLTRGAGVGMRLYRTGRQVSLVVSARVVYVREDPAGTFITGCAFDHPLADEQLHALL